MNFSKVVDNLSIRMAPFMVMKMQNESKQDKWTQAQILHAYYITAVADVGCYESGFKDVKIFMHEATREKYFALFLLVATGYTTCCTAPCCTVDKQEHERKYVGKEINIYRLSGSTTGL